MNRVLLTICFLLAPLPVLAAAGVYLSQEAFLEKRLGKDREVKMLWITPELREAIKADLHDSFAGARTRYWQGGEKRAWILEYVGRDKPITMGFVVEDGQVTSMDVLVFRESRGYEIKYPYFTKQMHALSLNRQFELSHSIDNITGATLSVNAVKKGARMALYLDTYIEKHNP